MFMSKEPAFSHLTVWMVLNYPFHKGLFIDRHGLCFRLVMGILRAPGLPVLCGENKVACSLHGTPGAVDVRYRNMLTIKWTVTTVGTL